MRVFSSPKQIRVFLCFWPVLCGLLGLLLLKRAEAVGSIDYRETLSLACTALVIVIGVIGFVKIADFAKYWECAIVLAGQNWDLTEIGPSSGMGSNPSRLCFFLVRAAGNSAPDDYATFIDSRHPSYPLFKQLPSRSVVRGLRFKLTAPKTASRSWPRTTSDFLELEPDSISALRQALEPK